MLFISFTETTMRTKLRAARLKLGMSQEQLGELIVRSRSTVAKYELGGTDIPGSVLERLRVILGITLEELLYREPTPAKSSPTQRQQHKYLNVGGRNT
jgi:transcriptional regulator with XRE-family HTH domain